MCVLMMLRNVAGGRETLVLTSSLAIERIILVISDECGSVSWIDPETFGTGVPDSFVFFLLHQPCRVLSWTSNLEVAQDTQTRCGLSRRTKNRRAQRECFPDVRHGHDYHGCRQWDTHLASQELWSRTVQCRSGRQYREGCVFERRAS